MGGCENLPNPRTAGKAYGYYRRGGDIDLYVLPYVEESEIQRILNHWHKYGKGKIKLFGGR
jgi:hypothetical protein